MGESAHASGLWALETRPVSCAPRRVDAAAARKSSGRASVHRPVSRSLDPSAFLIHRDQFLSLPFDRELSEMAYSPIMHNSRNKYRRNRLTDSYSIAIQTV